MMGFGRFKSDQRGSTMMMFGLAVVPVVLCFGGAIDYGRAGAMKTNLQAATDSAALSLVKMPATATSAQISAQAQKVFNGVFKSADYTGTIPVTATKSGKTYTVTASLDMPNAFMKMAGFATSKVGAISAATAGTRRIELALVLDNTGSMNDSIGGQRKIDALKEQAKALLTALRDAATDADTVKVSIVPFDTEVRLAADTYRYKPWFRWDNAADAKSWTGYVFDRYGSYATSDAAPSLAVKDSLFPPQMKSASAPLATVKPLTSVYAKSDFDALTALVDSMQPRGNTNIALGLMWGLATMSSSEPFTEASPASDNAVKRFTVLLTDGDNTQSHIDGAPNSVVSKIDASTTAACTAVKSANIELFTIRLLAGNAGLLSSCATDAKHYADVKSQADLSRAFKDIRDAILDTRFTM